MAARHMSISGITPSTNFNPAELGSVDNPETEPVLSRVFIISCQSDATIRDERFGIKYTMQQHAF